MAVQLLMPALSPTMEEGTLAKWLKKEGDKVSSGDVIAEIETDKATMEYEAADEGILGKILVPEGTMNVKVNSVIGILLEEGDEADTIETTAQTSSSIIVDEPKIEATTASTKLVTVREALNQAIEEEMHKDENVFILGEEVAQYQGAYKVTQGLLEKFGAKRVVDTPITEMGFAGLGIGSAFVGLRPIIEFMTFNFAMQAIDQIINSAAKTHYMSGGQISAPIVFRGPNGAASRVGAQHSQCYAAWYSSIPGLKVIMPYTASDAKGLLKAAIRDDNPVIFLENELLYGHKFEVNDSEDLIIPIGKGRLHKAGKDVTIVSFGIGMKHVDASLPELEKLGIDAEVIDLRTIRPMDLPMVIESVKKTGRLVTVEEGFPQCCIGDYIANKVNLEAFDYLDAPIITVAGKDVPMPYAENLEKLALPSITDIVEAVKLVTYTK